MAASNINFVEAEAFSSPLLFTPLQRDREERQCRDRLVPIIILFLFTSVKKRAQNASDRRPILPENPTIRPISGTIEQIIDFFCTGAFILKGRK